MKNISRFLFEQLFYLVLFVPVIFLSCKEKNLLDKYRHQSIPNEAIWTGGSDGGYYIEVIEAKNNEVRIRTYWYSTGLETDANTVIMDYNQNNLNFVKNNLLIRKNKTDVYVVPLINNSIDTNIKLEQISALNLENLKSVTYTINSKKEYFKFSCSFYDFAYNFSVIKINNTNALLQVIIFPSFNDSIKNELVKTILHKIV